MAAAEVFGAEAAWGESCLAPRGLASEGLGAYDRTSLDFGPPGAPPWKCRVRQSLGGKETVERSTWTSRNWVLSTASTGAKSI